MTTMLLTQVKLLLKKKGNNKYQLRRWYSELYLVIEKFKRSLHLSFPFLVKIKDNKNT